MIQILRIIISNKQKLKINILSQINREIFNTKEKNKDVEGKIID